MKNFIQTGAMITVPAPTGGVASGQGMIVGGLFGIAATTAPEGSAVEIGPLVYRPVYELGFTYEAASGVIEVVGDRKAERRDLAKVFCPTSVVMRSTRSQSSRMRSRSISVRVSTAFRTGSMISPLSPSQLTGSGNVMPKPVK